MAKKALIVWGGWHGHTPEECANVFAPWLESEGYDVTVETTLDVFADGERLAETDLITPIWTMGDLAKEQEQGVTEAVANGAGIAGFHGGMCDAFRKAVRYQWMTGGNWVAHPGNKVPEYTIDIVDRDHEITRGIDDFQLRDTEQYYLHTDPSNVVLATTTFDCPDAPTGHGTVMPAVWTRQWGKGRVFYASFGHTDADFQVPEALAIVRRGMKWATR